MRALVVGASGGIGSAIALAMAGRGDTVTLAARRVESIDVGLVEARGGRAHAIQLDLRDEGSVEAGVGKAADLMGGLDVVVGAAGISPIYKSVAQTTVEEWDQIFETNARGAFLLARAVGRQFIPARHGTLVFVTSIHEHVGDRRLAAYSASKGAVSMLVRSLALEWAPFGMRANCVAPAYVATALTEGLRGDPSHRKRLEAATPIGRIADPADVAGVVLFLTSEDARYITGTTLFVDGGWTAQ